VKSTQRPNRRASGMRLRVILAMCAVAALAACGTRLSDSAIETAAQGVVPSNAVGTQGSNNTASGGSEPLGGSSAGTGSVSGGFSGGKKSGGSTTGTTGSVGAGSGGTSVGSGSGTGSATRGGTAGGTVSGPAAGGNVGGGVKPATGSSGNAPCTSQGAPLIIGQPGAFSGFVGQSAGNMKLGMSVWAKYVNANGGLQCHPVQLYQEDDGADPSKTAANVNDLVKNKHVVALVGSDTSITIAAEQSTADALGVPMVGGELVVTDWNTDPNMFPQGGSALQVDAGLVAEIGRETHVSKIGLLYCVEASICGVVNQNFAKIVAPSHMNIVGTKSVSLTQATFTSECQSMKSGGAQLVFTYMDSAALTRFVSSCDSIDYHPVLASSAIALAPSVFANPSLQRDTVFYGNAFVPFTATGTPALDTMHNSFKQYAGQDVPDEPSVAGWTSGLLLQAAIDALVNAARNGPITSAMVVQGLLALHQNNLGGMVPPLTFIKGKPAPINPCYTVLELTTSGQRAPNGYQFSCQNI